MDFGNLLSILTLFTSIGPSGKSEVSVWRVSICLSNLSNPPNTQTYSPGTSPDADRVCFGLYVQW